jgi:hypothetical protein
MQNDNTKKMDTIENSIWPQLRSLNYRKSRGLFNRLQPDGIVHAISFQMGQNWSILFGKFTIEVGIFIPEVYSAFWEKPIPKFVPLILVKREKDLELWEKAEKIFGGIYPIIKKQLVPKCWIYWYKMVNIIFQCSLLVKNSSSNGNRKGFRKGCHSARSL